MCTVRYKAYCQLQLTDILLNFKPRKNSHEMVTDYHRKQTVVLCDAHSSLCFFFCFKTREKQSASQEKLTCFLEFSSTVTEDDAKSVHTTLLSARILTILKLFLLILFFKFLKTSLLQSSEFDKNLLINLRSFQFIRRLFVFLIIFSFE